MAIEIGDKVRFNSIPKVSEVIAVGPCTNSDHQDEFGGPCDQTAVTVDEVDPATDDFFVWHEDGFVKVED